MAENRAKLKLLKSDYALSRKEIATLAGVSVYTVNSWFNPETSKNCNELPDNMLRLIRLEIKFLKLKKVNNNANINSKT